MSGIGRGHGLQQFITPESERSGDSGPQLDYAIVEARVCALIPLFELQTDDPLWDSPLSLTISMGEDKEVFWRMLGRGRAKARQRLLEKESDG